MDKPLRVLFVNRMASMVRGGGETFDLEISRHMTSLGCEVTFLSGIPLTGSAAAPITDRKSITLRSPYTGGLKWDRIPGGWRLRLADFYLFETRAANWIHRHRDAFDVVQACELPYLVRALKDKKIGLPISLRLTAPDYHDEVGGLKDADQVVASGDTMQKMRAGARPDCVDIPNGVDTEIFKPQPSSFRAQHGLADDNLLILFVARFQTVKNHPMLIRAFKKVRDQEPKAKLLLAGSGPFESTVRDAVTREGVGDGVVFLGEQAFADLPMVYAACDIKVISSDYESFCFAVLEGMASGLPFVVTETNWIPRLVVDGEGGFVVPIGDDSAMAEGLLKLAGDRDLRERMGARNRREAAANYGWPSSAQKLKDAYLRLLK